MTIIAFKSGVMAADSGMWNHGRVIKCGFPKITRGADESLWFMAGKAFNVFYLREWVLAGMDHGSPPVFMKDPDETDDYISSVGWAKPDGSLWIALSGIWRFSCLGLPGTDAAQGCWGEGNAATFCEGAMAAGLSAPEAVALTIRSHTWAHGDVQVERIGPCHAPGSIVPIDVRHGERFDQAVARARGDGGWMEP